MCEECNTNFTPRSVVHAKGDQFPSLCHAMRCYGIAVADISQVAISCVHVEDIYTVVTTILIHGKF